MDASRLFKKNPFTVKERQILPYDAPDYNMRASLSNEKDMGSTSMVRTMVSQWKDHKKIFRYMIRHTLTHPDFPLSVDVSIVKQSRQKGKYVEQSYTFTEAGLSKSPERYEIEIEMDNLKVGVGSKYSTTESLYMAVKRPSYTYYLDYKAPIFQSLIPNSLTFWITTCE